MKNRVAALALVLGLLVAPAPVRGGTADIGYCSGYYGMTVYTAFNYGGTARTFCGGSLAVISVPDLRSYGLDNAISSLKTRNAPSSSKRSCLYAGYNYAQNGVPVLSVIGNVDMPNLSLTNPNINNLTSSLRSRPSGSYCP
jgi:hypothetical protein